MDSYVRHGLLARNPDVLGQGGAEHHDLLVVRSVPEDLLNVSAHVWMDDVEMVRCNVENRGNSK